jgi:hypothetical protein
MQYSFQILECNLIFTVLLMPRRITEHRSVACGIAPALGWMIEGSVFESWMSQKFPLLYVIQPDSGAQSASYLMGNRAKTAGVWS